MRPMRSIPFVLVLLISLSPVAAQAQAAGPLPPCRPQAVRGAELTIDAASLTTTGGRRHDLDDDVTVLVINENPLLFDYRLEGREVVIADEGLVQGIALLFPFAQAFGDDEAPPPPPPAEDDDEAPPETEAAEDVEVTAPLFEHPCGPVVEPIEQRHDEIDWANDDAFEAASDAKAAHNRFVTRTNALRALMLTSGVECGVLQAAIQEYRREVTTFEQSTAVETFHLALKEFRTLLEAQRDSVRRAPSLARLISPECLAAVAEASERWEARIEASASDLDELQAVLKKISDDLAATQKNLTAIDLALSGPHPFFSVLELGPFDLPTDVFVKLSSRPAADPKATHAKLGEWKLNFGGTARFALAAGGAYSSLGTRTFERVHGFARDREGNLLLEAGNEVSGQIVGIDEESDQRVGPLVALHTRLGGRFPANRLNASALHFSIGLSAGIVDDDLTGNLLVGPSVSFAEERLFLTVGAYYGKTNVLGGNLFVGGLVPEEVTEIPVVREGHWKLGAAVSYRFEVDDD